MTETMYDVPKAEGGLSRLAELVAAARSILGDGRAVDLSGIERETQAVCEAIKRLHPDLARPLKTRLLALLDDMNRLAAEISRQRLVLADEIARLDGGRLAATAYAQRRP